MSNDDLNQKPIKFLKKLDIIIVGIISLIVLIVGIILINAGYNEAFYVPNATVRSVLTIFTEVGSEMAYVALLAIFLFMINWQIGRGLFVQFFINNFANSLLKDIFMDPRPQWNYTPDGPIEDSYGFPSGHSQNAMSFWGHIFFWKKNTEKSSTPNLILMIVAIFFMIILPVSRVIIGVHDLQDIVGGTVIGLVILVGYFLITPLLVTIKQKPLVIQIFFGVALAFTLWVIVLLTAPQATEGVGQSAGLLFAGAIAFPIEEKYIRFEPSKYPLKQRLLCGIIGVIITFAFYLGLGAIFGVLSESLNWLWRFIRYIILGLILILGVPKLLTSIIKNPTSDK